MNASATKVRPHQVIGGMIGGIGDFDFEKETAFVSSTAKGAGEAVTDLFKTLVGGETSNITQSKEKKRCSWGNNRFSYS